MFLLVALLQYPLIFFHELGHALVARALGYESIRIFIGSGKTLFYFSFLNFIWLINLVPFGGLTYAKPRPPVRRSQWILYVAGGLIVNLSLLLAAWIANKTDFHLLPANVLQALFWANALVILENILPCTYQTTYGPLASDGKLLYEAIFRWNKPLTAPKPPGKVTRLTLRLLRLVGVGILACCAAAFFLLALFFFAANLLQDDAVVRTSLALFFTVLGSLLLCYAWRLFKAPITVSNPSTNPLYSGFAELCSSSTANSDELALIQTQFQAGDFQSALHSTSELLARNPSDPLLLWTQADIQLAMDNPIAAEATCDRLLSQLAADDPSLTDQPGIYFTAVAKRLHAILLQNDGRFETECAAALRSIVSDHSKITLLDQLACIPLCHEKPHLYHLAEFCIRRALEIAPGTPTLEGTLGGLLAERGQFAEAEPYLRACYDRSSAPHDRGITSYYLALLAAKNGDSKTARKLAQQSIALHPEPWLTRKANSLLDKLHR